MTVQKTLDKALHLIATDVDKIAALVDEPGPLDRTEAAKLTDYVKTLIQANKNDRENAKLDGLDQLTDEELAAMAKEVMGANV